MADADSNLVPIPAPWRVRVIAILRHDNSSITTTHQSNLDWEAAFPSEPWNYLRFEAMATALDRDDVLGKAIAMKEPGETYAFWFYHRSTQLYGKINLLPTGKIILIYSSHTPRKGKESL